MSSKDKKKPSGDDGSGAPDNPKKPARTIDLEAEEVVASDDELEQEDKSAEGGTAANGDDSTGDEKDSAVDQPESGDAGADGAAAIDAGKPPPPPQRTRPSDIRAFVTHLAAGLVGGLVGVIGAGIGLDKLPVAGLSASNGSSSKTAQYEERLLEINTALEEQAKSLAKRPAIADLEALKKRLEAIEAKPAPEASLPAEIGERLGKLEAALKSLESSSTAEGGASSDQALALTARLDRLETALETRAALLEEQIEQARALVTQITDAQAGSGADPAALAAVEKRLEGLEEKLSQLASRPVPKTDDSKSSAGNGAGLALAFQALRRAADNGRPFKDKLAAFEQIAGGSVDVGPLSGLAEAGAPTRTELLNELPAVLSSARATATRSEDKTILGRLASNAQSIVRIRKIGPANGNGTMAILSRIEAAAKGGDMDAAMAGASQLEGAAASAIAPWLKKAKARDALDVALAKLESRLLTVLGGAGSEPG